MHRFLLRPRWLAFHVVVVAAIAGMLLASRWQWHRHQARDDLEQRFAARVDAPPVALDDLLTDGIRLDDIEWRPITATGRFDDSGEIRIVNRSFEGRAGDHIATPFVLDDGRVLVVDRGWVPIDADAPDAGGEELTITGRLRLSQQRGRGQLGDRGDGELELAQRIDLDRLGPQLGGDVVPMYVELVEPVPEPGVLPAPVPAELGASPAHLSYTFQWLIFAACVAIGWLLAVRRSIAKHISAASGPAPPGSPLPAGDEPATTPS